MLGVFLCADDLVLMNVAIKGFSDKFRNLMLDFEFTGLRASLGNTIMMVNGGITNDG